jgi:hypothetical protein
MRIVCFFFFVFFLNISFAQEISYRKQIVLPNTQTVKLDTLTIYPNSFEVFLKQNRLTKEEYFLDITNSQLTFFNSYSDTLILYYRVLPFNLSKAYIGRDTSQIYTTTKGDREKFLITNSTSYEDVFGNSGLTKNGSISRGVSFGNNQNVSLNSSLNLELSGELAPNLKILASISDNNIPMQPEGNTSKIQEFDQVYIQLYNDKTKFIAGDYWISKPEGYFLNYKKRGQGFTMEHSITDKKGDIWNFGGAAGISKGKYARQIIQGIEGNQGPYRLKGNENEPFIIILSGTERVYIDGKLVTRGQENDYIINYNTSELIFTTRNTITKDIRIVVEFQYTDQNYARTLFTANTMYQKDRFTFWSNVYSEQDSKNQSLQQALTSSQKSLFYQIGDSLQLAHSLSIDSIGFLENQNEYEKRDTLGFKDVLVYSINPSKAIYQVTFSNVGPNKGDYIFSNFNALGKVYQWVAPLNGVSQGDYAPVRLLISPKQKQLATAGSSFRINKRNTIETEFGLSKNDINTFSPFNSNDDNGISNRTRLRNEIPLGNDSLGNWVLKSKLELEYLSTNFSPIEIFRTVEFDRDWNTRNKGFIGDQLSTNGSMDVIHKHYGNIYVEGSRYKIGQQYLGNKGLLSGKWKKNGLNAEWTSSYLASSFDTISNEYLRHKINISQDVGKFRIGYQDDQERNIFNTHSFLNSNSYSFYDYQFYISNSDSTSINYKLFYRERFDHRSDSIRLASAAKAKNIGAEVGFITQNYQRFHFLLNYRELEITNATLMNQSPENTLLGRADYDLKFWKGAFTWNTFYEIGSGLELKKEFLYIKVNDGQGVYTWIDYNGDGIKDLNEFEIAQFIDQASYIRVFTPSNQYIKMYSNELNQSIFLKPERLWSNSTGVKKGLSIFSNQLRMRIHRKTNAFDANTSLNSFASAMNDTTLISTNTNVRNTLFINRTSPKIGGEIVYQNIESKTLLATGFDARNQTYTEFNLRWNIVKTFFFESIYQYGNKEVRADYTTGRNFKLNYFFVKPIFSYQPSTMFRLSTEFKYSDKQSITEEMALGKELTIRAKYNKSLEETFQGSFSMIDITFTGVASSAIGYEMLESLKPGKNFTWNFSYQRTISKKTQLSIQYSGRKSESNRMIHTGGMEVRAFF